MKQVMIVGGGVAGLSAARALEGWGISVHLVEKQERLGGKSYDWACMATSECRNCGACLSAELSEEVESLANAQVYLETEVSDVRNEGNSFRINLKGRHTEEIAVDSVLLATGFEPFNPSEIESLGYLKRDRVITTQELNSLLKREALANFLPQKANPSIGFIQCVGSRNREQGRDYCSQVCCKVAIRQADKIMALYPGADISLFYMDLQVIGKETRSQFERIGGNLKLIQGVPGEILGSEETEQLTMIQEDPESGERVAHQFDAVILAVGMLPAVGSTETSEFFGAETNQWGFFKGHGSSIGNGIYAAGAAQGPTDILDAKSQGLIAAHDIAKELGAFSSSNTVSTVAVIGKEDQGLDAAKVISSRGYHVKFMDKGYHEPELLNPCSSSDLEYFPNSTVLEVSGNVGEFSLNIKSDNKPLSIEADAIIVATGAQRGSLPVRDSLLEDNLIIGLDRFQAEMEDKTENPERIGFLTDFSGPEWKSNARRSLLLASRLAEQGKDVYFLMEKMLVNGLEGQQIYDTARKNGVRFLRVAKEHKPGFSKNGKTLEVSIKEATLGNISMTIEFDLLVIPEPVLPSEDNKYLDQALQCSIDIEGFLQKPNVRHRHVSSFRRGIFFLGSCHDEKDDDDFVSELHEVASSLKMPFENLNGPNNPAAEIDSGLCSRCLTCFRTCSHGAITLRDGFQPIINHDACFGCGQCVAFCPAKAISQDWIDDLPLEKGPFESQTVVFMCRRSAKLADNEAQKLGMDYGKNVRTVKVPCAGSLDMEWVLAPILEGAERVIVAGCHEGNCRSGEGGSLAVKKLKRTIKDTGIEEDVFRYESIAANEPIKLNRILSDKEA